MQRSTAIASDYKEEVDVLQDRFTYLLFVLFILERADLYREAQ